MKNKIEDLYNHLFATIEALQDADNPMEVSRAKAICQVASATVEIAKTENDYLRITGAKEGSGFIPKVPRPPLPLGAAPRPMALESVSNVE